MTVASHDALIARLSLQTEALAHTLDELFEHRKRVAHRNDQVHLEIVDIHHIIEAMPTNAPESNRIFKGLKQTLVDRRRTKDFLFHDEMINAPSIALREQLSLFHEKLAMINLTPDRKYMFRTNLGQDLYDCIPNADERSLYPMRPMECRKEDLLSDTMDKIAVVDKDTIYQIKRDIVTKRWSVHHRGSTITQCAHINELVTFLLEKNASVNGASIGLLATYQLASHIHNHLQQKERVYVKNGYTLSDIQKLRRQLDIAMAVS